MVHRVVSDRAQEDPKFSGMFFDNMIDILKFLYFEASFDSLINLGSLTAINFSNTDAVD
jgi:hypothetical protein